MDKLLAAALVVCAASLPGTAIADTQIYRSVDEQGNAVFSDQPPPPGTTAEEVDLQDLNTAPAPEPRTRDRPQPQEERERAPAPSVTITAPDDETTIAMGPGNFSVSGSTTPPLGAGEQLQLFMDGEAVGQPRKQASWSLTGVLRGPHDLVIRRLDRNDRVIAESEAVRVFVLRPSIR